VNNSLMSSPGVIGLYLVVGLLILISNWKVFEKAGRPGWAAIIPIYNAVVLLQIVGKPTWWVLLLFVPVANIIVSVIVCLQLAKKFGYDIGFGIGLILLSVVFLPMLAFGSAQYRP
jgi:hypothetical protein